jgi:hypothetical protein
MKHINIELEAWKSGSIKFSYMQRVKILKEAEIFEKFNMLWLPPIYLDKKCPASWASSGCLFSEPW